MKKVRRILTTTLKVLGYLLLTILIGLLLSVLISKKDYNDPTAPIGAKLKAVALRNAHIIPMQEDTLQIITGHTLLIDRGIILDILPDSVEIPARFKRIDLNGKYVLPGLIDMHSHIFDRSDLPMYLGYGVTTVRNMMGFPMHLRWRDQINKGAYPGARLITATPTINEGSNTSPFHKNIDSAEEAANAVRKYKEEGYDFIKIYDGLTLSQFKAIMREAKKAGLKVAGHPPHDIDLDTLLNYPINTYEHIEEVVQGMMDYKLDTVHGRKIAKKLKKHQAKITVTLSPFHAIYKTTTEGTPFLENIPTDQINPFVRFIGNRQLQQWVNANEGTYEWNVKKYECMEALVRIFDEEGVTMLLGTDTGPNLTIPGLTLHNEIALLAKNGLTPHSILRSGTANAAKALGLEKELGTIAVGKKAELLVVEQNPLEQLKTLKHPHMILTQDIFYDQEAIVALRDLGRNKAYTYTTIGRFLDHLLQK
ncbi:amidohydrolase family protein [Spongiimicrobium sp. 3-5]|uniref:amidohydrolase family protein n=1 Tax=Spongiimicrobium sp. 3-5 TaxID=3332596 RepID=UPI0039804595